MWMYFFLNNLDFYSTELKTVKTAFDSMTLPSESVPFDDNERATEGVRDLSGTVSEQKKCRYQISHLGSISFASLKIFSFKGFHITRFNFKGRWEA